MAAEENTGERRHANQASQQGSSAGGQGSGPSSDRYVPNERTSPRPGPARQPGPASRPSPTRPDPQSQSLSRSYGSNLPTSLTYIILSTRGYSPWRPAADMGTNRQEIDVALSWIFKVRGEDPDTAATAVLFAFQTISPC